MPNFQQSFWSLSLLANISWWCHQMETFSVLLTLWAGNSPVTGVIVMVVPYLTKLKVAIILYSKRVSRMWQRQHISTMATQIIGDSIICSIFDYANIKKVSKLCITDEGPVNYRRQGPVMRKVFPCHDFVIDKNDFQIFVTAAAVCDVHFFLFFKAFLHI